MKNMRVFVIVVRDLWLVRRMLLSGPRPTTSGGENEPDEEVRRRRLHGLSPTDDRGGFHDQRIGGGGPANAFAGELATEDRAPFQVFTRRVLRNELQPRLSGSE